MSHWSPCPQQLWISGLPCWTPSIGNTRSTRRLTLWCAISLWATRRNRLFPTWRGRCCARTQASLAPLYGGLDHREQPSAVVVNRKRARDEVGREIGNVEPLHLGVAETGGLEEATQIGQRPELNGGRVAAALPGVEGFGLGGLLGSEAVADDHSAAGRSETDHLHESHGGLLEVVEGEAAGNNVERSVGERCLIDVPGAPFD